MAKRFLLICLCMTMILCFAACNSNSQDAEEYFYEINKLIQDEDFHYAGVKNGKIVLYDSQQNTIQEIPFEQADENVEFLYARKEGPAIFFVTSGTIDDEHGILFINDDVNNVLEGIKYIKRIGGNSYEYDTAD